ncbi:MAG: oligoribonuclease [Planctomycetes bacterium]|jgi:oligoribonuclease|nr:oligoribonuclease [Planctomycetota bacterium]
MPADAPNLIWIDLEMTGLDPDSCFIMEIATLVTNSELELVAEGPNLVIHNSDKQLESLSEWCKDHFGKSGLIERVRASTVSIEDAEAQTLAFLKEHVTAGASPLCGNSVHNDRAFLWRHMRRVHDCCHYRNVDVSTIKVLLKAWYPSAYSSPPKAESHEALADIRESVEELRHYRKHFFTSSS